MKHITSTSVKTGLATALIVLLPSIGTAADYNDSDDYLSHVMTLLDSDTTFDRFNDNDNDKGKHHHKRERGHNDGHNDDDHGHDGDDDNDGHNDDNHNDD